MSMEKVIPAMLIPQIKQALIKLDHATESTPDNMVQEIYHKYVTVYRTSPLEVPNMPYGIAFLPSAIRNLVSEDTSPPVDLPFAPMLVTPSTGTLTFESISDLEIDWGDGTVQTVKSGSNASYESLGIFINTYTHEYDTDFSDKVISIKTLDGVSPIQYFSSTGIKVVDRWYSQGYSPLIAQVGGTPMSQTFMGLGENLEQVPNVSPPNTTDISGLFFMAKVFNQDISDWDVSRITNMLYLFFGAELFNQDISGWDVSSVTDMTYTFNGAKSFNQDLSSWVTNKVTSMKGMFMMALSFDQSLANWCVSLITDAPEGFAESTTLFTNDKHPVWGTCPVA